MNAVELPSFQLKARRPSTEFDLFLESTNHDTWTFRRDGRVQRSIEEVITTRAGLPIVDPAVQLLYMAKSEEPKNQHDFEVAARRSTTCPRSGCDAALAVTHPGHRWLLRL